MRPLACDKIAHVHIYMHVCRLVYTCIHKYIYRTYIYKSITHKDAHKKSFRSRKKIEQILQKQNRIILAFFAYVYVCVCVSSLKRVCMNSYLIGVWTAGATEVAQMRSKTTSISSVKSDTDYCPSGCRLSDALTTTFLSDTTFTQVKL